VNNPDPSLDTETTPDGSPRDQWTTIHSGGETEWYRHTWTIQDARARLLDAFLAAPRQVRVVNDAGDAVAVVMHPDTARQLEQVHAAIEEMKQQPEDDDLHPALHGPYTGGDNLLMDTEVIRRELAWMLARRDIGDPPSREEDALGEWRATMQARADEIQKEQDAFLLGASIHVAMSVAFWPDERGVVPVRAWHRREDGAEQEAHWQLAYTTPARGLFVVGRPGLFEQEYTVVTGSGWAIRGGFSSQDAASGFAVAIADAVPGIDWRVWDVPLTEMPASLREALMDVARKWLPWGPKDEAGSERAEPAAEDEPGDSLRSRYEKALRQLIEHVDHETHAYIEGDETGEDKYPALAEKFERLVAEAGDA
jgi:hypothetical protein